MLQGNNRIETSQSAVSSGHKPVDERQHDRRVDISSAWTRPSRPSRLHDRHFVPPGRVSAQVDQAHGHTVHLMAPKFVAPYRMSGKLGKNDAADAMAICEVVQRPNMRFVPIKTEDQQSGLLVHRARQGFVEARTATINRIRGLMSEFGVVLPLKAEVVRSEARNHLEERGLMNSVCIRDPDRSLVEIACYQ